MEAQQQRQLTKRFKAKLLGQIAFATLRSATIQKILQPAYRLLATTADWTDLQDVLNTERRVYNEVIEYINQVLQHGPSKADARTYAEGPALFTDATDNDGGAQYGKKKMFYRGICSKYVSSAAKELRVLLEVCTRHPITPGSTIYMDSETAVGALQRGSSTSQECHRLIQLIMDQLAGIHVSFRYLAGSQNPADSISRREEEATSTRNALRKEG